jgi:hypothetical protein
MMRAWWMLGVLVMGCDDAADPPVAPPIDSNVTDAHIDDFAILDMRPDPPAMDMRAIDMRRDQALDMRPDRAMDMARDHAIDAAPDLMPVMDAAIDMAPVVDAAPDMSIVDQGPPREQACFDEMDNDGDGRIDCADPDCRPQIACFDAPEDCGNGVDDNGDDWVDCDDVLCLSECPPQPGPALDVAAIQARFDMDCVGCHSEPQPAAQLDLTAFVETTVDVRSTQVNGFRVVSGDHRASYMWRKMAYEFRNFEGGGGEGMPPIDAMDAHFVRRFGDWIDALPP